MNVAGIQQICYPDKDQSLKATADAITAACTASKLDLILLQELHSTQYFCQTEDPLYFNLAETIPGKTTHAIAALAKAHNVVIVCSVFEKRAPGLYHNTAVVIERDGSIAGTYRKMHIPDDPGFYEKFYFTPGDSPRNDGQSGFTPIQTSAGMLGVLVCWDQWYPEAARLMALAGADILLYPTAIGWDLADNDNEQQRQLDAWITIQRSHAIANGIPVMSVNRVGFEPEKPNTTSTTTGIQFWGNSFICGPQGEIINQADENIAYTIQATLDFKHSEAVRQIWPYFRDRRVDAYADLSKRYRD